MLRILCGCLLVGWGLLNSARAHFVWLLPAGADTPARICFGEGPEPGEAALVDKVAGTKVWLRPAQGEPQSLEISRETKGEQGWWKVAGQGGSLVATCDYGVLKKGDAKFHLMYYAKCQSAAGQVATSGTNPMILDIVATPVEAGWKMQATYLGKPAPRVEFTWHEADGSTATATANDAGEAIWKKSAGHTLRGARVRQVVPEEKAAGQATETRHYATLVLAPAPAPSLAAPEALKKARAGRAVWKDFTGFSADYTLRIDGQTAEGKLVVDENGDGQFKLSDKTMQGWLSNQLSSLVQHRLPTFDAGQEATFADEPADHPLGRKIILGDPKLESVYRIRDDVVTEVNRRAGNIRFTISVLEIERNAEGKYLPRFVTLTNWEQKTGEIQSAQTVMNTWKRIGKIDLPERVLEIETRKDQRSVRELQLSNLQLTPADTKSGAEKTSADKKSAGN